MDVGEWLIERRGELDRGEAGWLERLAEFDRDSCGRPRVTCRV